MVKKLWVTITLLIFKPNK